MPKIHKKREHGKKTYRTDGLVRPLYPERVRALTIRMRSY